MTASCPHTFAYAVRFLAYVATHADQARPVRSAVAAADLGLSAQYLRTIVAALSRASLISALRGPHGGVRLAKPATDITILDIYRAVRGAESDPCMPPQAPHADRLLAATCARAASSYRRSLGRRRLSEFLS